MSEEQYDYLKLPEVKQEEEVWCTIGEGGKLDVFKWDFVEKQAAVYDRHPANLPRDNVQIICKLAVLVREQTIENCMRVLGKYKEHTVDSSVIFLKEPEVDNE